jgi:hypothetical protein
VEFVVRLTRKAPGIRGLRKPFDRLRANGVVKKAQGKEFTVGGVVGPSH